jgi:4-alpha-glucanotransferase
MLKHIMEERKHQLRKLAESFGVQGSYTGAAGRRRASSQSLLGVLAAMGAPLQSLSDVPEALHQRQRAWWQSFCEPVAVAWEGKCPKLEIRVPRAFNSGRIHVTLQEEKDEKQAFDFHIVDLPTLGIDGVDGTDYEVKRLPGLGTFPFGYYHLEIETGSARSEMLLISAPGTAFSPDRSAQRSWGIMAPLYAIHSKRSWGAGNLSDLTTLWHWTESLGGKLVATLPFMAAFLDEPFDPSPYAPASRVCWNEFYADPRETAEFGRCPAAQELVNSADFQIELADFRQAERIDYRRQMALRRRVLTELAEYCFSEGGERLESLRAFAAARPEVEEYARFRAVGERRRRPWTDWPEPLRGGRIADGDYDQRNYHYHLYSQWITEQQIAGLSATFRQGGSGLYLDLPLGVNRYGFDPWRHPELFAFSVNGGAPPDAFFTKGQNWNFAPLHPERIRTDGYRYLRRVIQGLLRHAGMLRIDHVMGLHRLYWIPEGMPAKDGVYVRYPAEELYAILCLESHRHRAWIVGENLGTVPGYVNTTMRRHAIHRTYVVQYELNPQEDKPPINDPDPHTVATVNTHDMPPFAAFWQGKDLDELHALGLFDESDIAAEHERRQTIRAELIKFLRNAGHLGPDEESEEEVLAAVLRYLAASPSQHVLVTLEDLWLENQRQNMPGTVDEHPNWRSKMHYSLEEIQRNPRFANLLKEVDQLRRG